MCPLLLTALALWPPRNSAARTEVCSCRQNSSLHCVQNRGGDIANRAAPTHSRSQPPYPVLAIVCNLVATTPSAFIRKRERAFGVQSEKSQECTRPILHPSLLQSRRLFDGKKIPRTQRKNTHLLFNQSLLTICRIYHVY